MLTSHAGAHCLVTVVCCEDWWKEGGNNKRLSEINVVFRSFFSVRRRGSSATHFLWDLRHHRDERVDTSRPWATMQTTSSTMGAQDAQKSWMQTHQITEANTQARKHTRKSQSQTKPYQTQTKHPHTNTKKKTVKTSTPTHPNV